MGNPQQKNPQAKNIYLLRVEGLINFQTELSNHNYFIYQSYTRGNDYNTSIVQCYL